jgi:hypothetical protein
MSNRQELSNAHESISASSPGISPRRLESSVRSVVNDGVILYHGIHDNDNDGVETSSNVAQDGPAVHHSSNSKVGFESDSNSNNHNNLVAGVNDRVTRFDNFDSNNELSSFTVHSVIQKKTVDSKGNIYESVPSVHMQSSSRPGGTDGANVLAGSSGVSATSRLHPIPTGGSGTVGGKPQQMQGPPSSSPPKRATGASRMAKAAKLLGNNDEAREIKLMLQQIWQKGGGQRSSSSYAEGSPTKHGLALLFESKQLAVVVNLRMSSSYYKIAYSCCIIGDVVAMLYSIGLTDPLEAVAMVYVAWVFQSIFLLDTFARLFVRSAGTLISEDCLKDNWFWFSVVISVCNIVALSEPNTLLDWVAILLMLRLLRAVRVFKTISIFFVDMKIILISFSSSCISLLYVILLVFLYFSYFAIIGIILFKRANPFHFANMSASYRTLFAIMMFDNWGDVMKQCMYGCKYYGYDDPGAVEGSPISLRKFTHSCNYEEQPVGEGMGFFAPIFFVVFAIITGMVLSSLLVGVIIKSLELLKEENNEEKEIRDKLVRVKRKYHLDNDTVTVYLKLFELIDKNSNGRLVFTELAIMLNALDMDSNEQFEFFIKVDTDKSGQIDFSEFTEMMAMISLSKKAHRGMVAASRPANKKQQAKQDNVKKDLEMLSEKIRLAPGVGGTADDTDGVSNRRVSHAEGNNDAVDALSLLPTDSAAEDAAAAIRQEMSSVRRRIGEVEPSPSSRGLLNRALSVISIPAQARVVPHLEPIDRPPAPRHAF